MAKKQKTVEEKIDDLAAMTQRGFVAVATDLRELEKRMNDRFDRLEFHMTAHERRIEILEDKVRIISTKIGLRK